MSWASKAIFSWHIGPCADWYNVYKSVGRGFSDTDGNGVADKYGSCFEPDLVENAATDAMLPPASAAGFYLVTTESGLGEGTLGWASNGLERPNTSPCP